MVDEKHSLKLSLLGAFILSVLGYLLLTAAGDGRMTLAESDQLLYMQYARNMADGLPLVFSPGDAPSTGSTTYLYIFLHSIIYKLGAQGELVYILSYLMNAAFYLGSIWMIWNIARVLVPKALGLAMAMSVLSFHLAAASLKQTDIGLFTFLALALFAALLHRRPRWALVLVILCALARPEGFVFAIAFGCCAVLKLLLSCFKRDQAPLSWKQYLLFAGCGFGAFGLILLINFIFTGDARFMSVAHKGYFNIYPLTGAIQHTLIDAVLIIKGVFLGLHDNARQFYLFPLLGGILGIIGILFKDRAAETAYTELWFGLAAIGSILLIASSQFAGVSNDRYLAWVLPVWIMYVVAGIDTAAARFGSKKPAYMICAVLLVGYQLVGLLNIASQTFGDCVSWESRKAFALRVKEVVPVGKSIGCTSGNGINYYMPEHKTFNLWGITSPDFHHRRKGDARSLFTITELIRHTPRLAFDFWVVNQQIIDANPWMKSFLGPRIISDLDQSLVSDTALSLYKADWTLLDGGTDPVLCTDQLNGLTLIDAMDVGFYDEELDHSYHLSMRLKSTEISPIYLISDLGGKKHMEVGRLILGREEFSVNGVNPSKPLTIILRTGTEAQAAAYFNKQKSSINNLMLNEELHLRVFVDGIEAEIPVLQLNESGFSEVAFTLPAELLSTAAPTISIVGDHISYAYWFAQ